MGELPEWGVEILVVVKLRDFITTALIDGDLNSHPDSDLLGNPTHTDIETCFQGLNKIRHFDTDYCHIR